ncbi:MAG: hypothetical protein IT522_02450 [Burkholderiales bacterium]|nr:hypothetical protein [Burkholderiales bacterium]
MGRLSCLFGRKPAPEPAAAPEGGGAGFGFGPQFATAEPIVREAFDEITANMGLSSALSDAFRDAFARADRAGDTRVQENVVTSHLMGSGWKWPEFDRWAKHFAEKKQWPYMWLRIDGLLGLGPDVRQQIDDALRVLKVAEMKEMLASRQALPKPVPRKRDEVVALVRKSYPEAELLEVARQRAIEQYKAPTTEQIEIAECKLLAHTITMRSYAVRDARNREQLARDVSKTALDVVAIDSDDPVERAYGDLFNRGELSGLPPFFPGDRTCLISRAAADRCCGPKSDARE